jgi:HAD superfamily phosphatase (TIGR01681 family)
MQEADSELISAIATIADVELIDLRGQGGAHYDLVRDRIGHIPYTQVGYAALALGLGRALHGCLTQPAKVLVVDCDNTLWGGVVGEDGAAGLTIDAGHRSLQAFLLRRKQSGQLITLASKNAEADVWNVFESRADMLLSRADIAAWRIDWQPKPDNIRALANELGLGLDSFIFLDDSPAECAAVAAALQEVTVVQLPGDPRVRGVSRRPLGLRYQGYDGGGCAPYGAIRHGAGTAAVQGGGRQRRGLFGVPRHRDRDHASGPGRPAPRRPTHPTHQSVQHHHAPPH